MLLLHAEISAAPAASPQLPSVRLHAAPLVQLPHEVDCNSPSHWDRGTLYIFMSTGHPFRSSGKDLRHLGAAESVQYDNKVNGGRWIEATCRADDGKLYGWYPVVQGLEPGGTDKLAGRKARFFMARDSKWEIEFVRPGEAGK